MLPALTPIVPKDKPKTEYRHEREGFSKMEVKLQNRAESLRAEALKCWTRTVWRALVRRRVDHMNPSSSLASSESISMPQGGSHMS